MKHDTGCGPATDELAIEDIAHDLNNLLTVIRSRAQLVLETETIEPETTESLNHIVTASNRAVALIQQLRSADCSD